MAPCRAGTARWGRGRRVYRPSCAFAEAGRVPVFPGFRARRGRSGRSAAPARPADGGISDRPRPSRGGGEYAPDMLYRFVRGLNEIYGVTVLFMFIAAFFIAFAFTLIYPIVPIILLFSSIFLVVILRGAFILMRATERGLARSALGRGACPACATRCDEMRVGEETVQECPGCRRVFAANGAPFVPEESAEPAQAANPA